MVISESADVGWPKIDPDEAGMTTTELLPSDAPKRSPELSKASPNTPLKPVAAVSVAAILAVTVWPKITPVELGRTVIVLLLLLPMNRSPAASNASAAGASSPVAALSVTATPAVTDWPKITPLD